MKTRTKVLHEVAAERKYQDKKWGGPSHDDMETQEKWLEYIAQYSNKADVDFRTRMVKVAALAVAAIESHDRKAVKTESVTTNENPPVEVGQS